MLFNAKRQKILRVAWMVLGIFVMVSMILLYMPIFGR
jgi:hypothetical protein